MLLEVRDDGLVMVAVRVVQRRAAPTVLWAVVSAELINEQLDHLKAALGASKMNRRSPVVVARINVVPSLAYQPA